MVGVGVSTHVAPTNSSPEAPSIPTCSLPAIGWPPTKRGRSTAATSGPFTPPTSVTTASPFQSGDDRMPAMTSAATWTGVATTTRSALRSSPSTSRAPSSTARAAVPGVASVPVTCQPWARSAMPTDPPMRPVPMTMARPGALARGAAPSVGEVVTEPLGALEVDVVDVVPGAFGGDVEHDPDAARGRAHDG